MASKGPRSKLDHETRARRQKALEAPREPRRPKTHWDHVLEEMVWLSKDFEAERKWKLAQAKRVALRASKGMLDQATRGEKKMKEEELRLKKVALNISKDVNKFWTKIQKLVLYKHQMELDDRKKKALDKQLEYLLGQTERYSTMLAENLIGTSNPSGPVHQSIQVARHNSDQRENDDSTANESVELYSATSSETETRSDAVEVDDDYNMGSGDELEDNEQTIEEDEALITEEERQEELAALQNEVDLPLEELLKRYSNNEVNGESSPQKESSLTHSPDDTVPNQDDSVDISATCNGDNGHSHANMGRRGVESNGPSNISESREADTNDMPDSTPNISESKEAETKDMLDNTADPESLHAGFDFNDEQEDPEFVITTKEEMDDETTLKEEEELAKAESRDPTDEIALLQKESEIPLEELLARYKKDHGDDGSVGDDESDYGSDHSDVPSSLVDQDLEEELAPAVAEDGVSGVLAPNSPSCSEQVVGHELDSEEGGEKDSRIADAAAAARLAQPTGSTFSTTNVRTKFPFLIKHSLREYQHIGLDWLVTMYEKKLNGILADEMGLGKTIMTIALLAHLACEKGIWGPHLIVVPTSVMLNWETEFLKWCPAFKILTYFGSAKERKHKRQGWMKPNSFHVCITTYRLVIQDSKIFKRKKWKYLILDEAHLIKNWKSQRWQTLLNFNSKRRILLTGTPLQNDLMELWSLMHFLMPHIFQSHQEFKDWFCNPISGMVEGQEKVNKEVIDRLHNVLRPFILRRLKRDVETQLPMKHEHVIYCRLSKRQRNLYEDFIASSETQATLASANFIGMLNVIMQLRKVCNHPDLFEGRPIVSSFDMAGVEIQLSANVCSVLSRSLFSSVDLSGMGFLFTYLDFSMTSWESDEIKSLLTPSRLIEECAGLNKIEMIRPGFKHGKPSHGTNIFEEIRKAILEERLKEAKERAASIAWWNSLRSERKPVYSTTLRELLTVKHPLSDIHQHKANPLSYDYSSKLAEVILSPVERFHRMIDQIESFMFSIPAARAPPPVCWCSRSRTPVFLDSLYKEKCSHTLLPLLAPIRPAIVRRQLYFPDRRLIQFDCGKLQQLAILLRRLKSEGHRALIFTQMTKMLDILEAFINLYGYTYMRLDGSTQPEERQTLMQRFNTNPKIFLFILSTRSGGVGINLVGADTVIFYDSDWNPAMDQQAQDRCHRIGQTREVHIYRLISESTIEENILKKANQKRALDNLVIQSGGYNTEFFKKLDPMELFSGHRMASMKNIQKERSGDNGIETSVSNADIEAALRNAEDEADYMALKKVEEEEAVDNQEFTEEPIGRLEDDELANEDDTRADESADLNALTVASQDEIVAAASVDVPDEEKALTFACDEDDADMLADVKQMAAAAAASGQAVSSFEGQLRPVDRYAMRFLELWDPIIDKAAMEEQVEFEQSEWELEHIEKLKEEMEAEIDDDEEPLVYERWDADLATQAYHQQVEALTHQLMEELESKAKEREDAENENNEFTKKKAANGGKAKSKKKKPKKVKFKSLKKESLASASEGTKEEDIVELMSSDDADSCQESVPSPDMSPVLLKKRKKADITLDVEEDSSKVKFKKTKKTMPPPSVMDLSSPGKLHDESKDSRSLDDGKVDLELKPASRARAGGKISITSVPTKRIFTIRPEKLKKKGNLWSSDCFPPPDSWLPQEDAIICAVVHEYGPNWSLVSETLYGMTAGGFYRGRFRHPVHCCERFRELVQKYVLSAADNPSNEKASSTGPVKTLLRVSEDNIQMLLDVALEQPDRELLLQRHFTALLTTVWKVKSGLHRRQSPSTQNNSLRKLFGASMNPNRPNNSGGAVQKMNFNSSGECSKLVTLALSDVDCQRVHDAAPVPKQKEVTLATEGKLEVVLHLGNEEGEGGHSSDYFPSSIPLLIPGSEPLLSAKIESDKNQLRSSQHLAEGRFRASLSACNEGTLGWASSAFPVSEPKSRSASKSLNLGKHKLSIGESSKHSKSKIRKISVDPSETLPELSEPVFQSLPLVSSYNDSGSFFSSHGSIIPDDSSEDVFHETLCSTNEEFPSKTRNLQLLHHCYDPEFISGLDDCPLPEHTDIG